MEEMKEKIRSSYLELQGYLNQLSNNDRPNIFSEQTWNNYNSTIEQLNELTSNNYNKFKLTPTPFGQFQKIDSNNFKIQLGGLISRIYGEYFFDERNPLDGSPSTIINTTQNQSQSIEIEIIMEMTEIITQKLAKYKEDTKERTFLEQVKNGLKSSKGIIELINLILSTGASLGLTTQAILQLLSR